MAQSFSKSSDEVILVYKLLHYFTLRQKETIETIPHYLQ